MLWPKKNSYKEFDNEKKFLRLENSPPPPISFLMVRPLSFKATLLTPTECANAFHSTNLLLFFHVPPTTTSAM